MKLKVNPTRQELLRIKKRLKTAFSGHALLKEKLDGLMREFLANVRDLKEKRKELEEKLPPALLSFFVSNNRIGSKNMEELIQDFPLTQAEVYLYNIMGVEIKEAGVNQWPLINCSAVDNDFSEAKNLIQEIKEKIISYANSTIKIRFLADEIEKTRRRVNSLEHVYIPEMEKARKYIFQKLEERERFDKTIILKLKQFIDN